MIQTMIQATDVTTLRDLLSENVAQVVFGAKLDKIKEGVLNIQHAVCGM